MRVSIRRGVSTTQFPSRKCVDGHPISRKHKVFKPFKDEHRKLRAILQRNSSTRFRNFLAAAGIFTIPLHSRRLLQRVQISGYVHRRCHDHCNLVSRLLHRGHGNTAAAAAADLFFEGFLWATIKVPKSLIKPGDLSPPPMSTSAMAAGVTEKMKLLC
ncbi:hypothetical protein M5K25_008595 [Dendrobium thyrsiflorum]|uniref:Uncharacterized protein n=1 Tax=Dendrobium thyrsiflorum TaxID=117978 RepID=A0ABD0VFS1_DENTH